MNVIFKYREDYITGWYTGPTLVFACHLSLQFNLTRETPFRSPESIRLIPFRIDLLTNIA